MGSEFMVSSHVCVLHCNHINPRRLSAGFNITFNNGNQLKGVVRFKALTFTHSHVKTANNSDKKKKREREKDGDKQSSEADWWKRRHTVIEI